MNKLRKEYTLGLGALFIIATIGVVLLQADWGSITKQAKVNNADHFIDAGSLSVAVSLKPEAPQVGKNTLQIQVKNKEGSFVSGATVRAVGEMPAIDTLPATYAQADIREIEPGIYVGDVNLSMPGAWPLAIDVDTGEGQHVDLTFNMVTGRKGLELSSATPVGDNAYHTCSMHPSVRLAEPGTCPICGMDLTPVTHEDLRSGSIFIDEGRRQSIGVKIGTTLRQEFTFPIKLHGQVDYDHSRLRDINLRFDGWIGELSANVEGKSVTRGDILFTVYSPELLSLQEEYLESIKHKSATQKSRMQKTAQLSASRKRLLLWGLTQAQIKWLEDQGEARDYMPIFAPTSGAIIEKNIVSGSAFKKGERLLRLADLSQVWVEANAYERDLPLLKTGMSASITLSNKMNASVASTVMQIDPFLSGNTRTAKVRLQVDNTDGSFQPGAFTQVTVEAYLGEVLLIPSDAILVSGEKRIVFRDLGEGRLKPVEVLTGYSNGKHTVINEGLDEGDKIVVSGNFLIASESKLKSGVDQW